MFHGSLVALVTPMDEESNIDYTSLERLIAFHLEQQSDGLVIAGSTGESETLTEEEINKLIHFVVRKVDSRIPVIAGTGASSTHKTIDKTFNAMELGVDGCLILTPGYVKPTQEGLYRHFKAISEAVPVPQILYNNPARTVCDMLPETVVRLAECSNIVGIKEAVSDSARYRQLIKLCGARLSILSGDDGSCKDLMLAGGKGVISVAANVAPKFMHEIAKAALSGDKAKADELDGRLQALFHALNVQSNPIPVKWAARQMGLIRGGIRLPLTVLSKEYHETVLQAMQAAGIMEQVSK